MDSGSRRRDRLIQPYRWYMEQVAQPAYPTIPSEVLAVAPTRRRRPVVVDANSLIEDALWRARTGFSALTLLAEQHLVSVVAPVHVAREVREHLPRVAARNGCRNAIEVFETVHLPLIQVVELPSELPADARVAGVAVRDADDAPLAHLAALLAPAVVLTRDRHLTREGFGEEDWLTTILLLRRLVELDKMFYGVSRFVSLGMYLSGLGLTSLLRRLAQSRAALGLAIGLVLGGALWFRTQLRRRGRGLGTSISSAGAHGGGDDPDAGGPGLGRGGAPGPAGASCPSSQRRIRRRSVSDRAR